MNNPDWDDLRYFLAVARKGSTLAASKEMRVSQSTVHRRLVELEKSFGRHLVIRHATGYSLTEFGRNLRPFAERVDDAMSSVVRYLSSSDDTVTGSVRVTCSESIGYRLMKSTLLDGFHARYVDLHVELIMSDRFLDLAKGEADVAIRAGEPDDDTLVGRKIGDVPWGLYCSRSYAQLNGKVNQVEDINNHAVIAFDGDIKNHHAARWLRTVAAHARVAAHSNSIPGLLIAVKSGAGVAPLPVPLATQEIELTQLLGPVAGLYSPIYLLTHPDLRRTPRVRVFFEYILDTIEQAGAALTQEPRDGLVRNREIRT